MLASLGLLAISPGPPALGQEAVAPKGKEEKKDEKKEERVATVVQLRLRGEYAEALPEQNPFGPSPLHFRGLLEVMRRAKDDPEVRAIYLKSETPWLGLSQVREVLAALKDFRSAGKKIYAFAEDPGTVDLLLLSAASRIEAPESAMVFLPGVSAEALYFKPLLDKLGVKLLVSHVGAYKSAFENYSRESMSPELREVLEGIVGAHYGALQEIIAEGRGIPRERVAEAIDRGFLSARDLLELGLVDEVADKEHFWGDVKADLDVEKLKILTSYGRKSFELDPQNPFALFRLLMEALSPPKKRGSAAPKVALVYANGVIVSGKSQSSPFGGPGVLGSDTLVEALKGAAGDASVKAIVVRIDSPGGSGLASDAIWRAVLDAKAKVPVVASMSNIAGSGGYYIAMGASRILAQPETITGSIGVVSALPNVKGTMDLLGIRVETVSRGKHAGTFSPFADPEKVDLAPLAKLMEDFYWQFVDKAAQGRGKTRDEIHAVAQGRVWTGRDALERGLVDEIGGLRRALEVARELAGVGPEEKLEVLELPHPPSFVEAISEAFGLSRLAAAAGLSRLELGALAALPEARAAVEGALRLLRVASEGTVLLVPFEVRVR
ncbi:MAG: signal peptide peptidase SppA [Planctomycetes bacterium]|nr:signal peptide peptidase SppA [Planctomycetota bacterium]